jgi:hypothetical protein
MLGNPQGYGTAVFEVLKGQGQALWTKQEVRELYCWQMQMQRHEAGEANQVSVERIDQRGLM